MNETTDFADIEKQKENIQPLKQGRSAKMLSLYLSPESERLKQENESQFEEKLRNLDDDDDPLQVYVNYVHWIENAYSSGPSPLLKVVEKAVRQFKNDARYKNDARFLKLWLIVAHQAKEPIDVFKYLSINGIGSRLSLYYEEYALLLEKNGRNKEAMELYKHGIQKGAQPLERLNRKFVEFQKRMIILPSDQQSNHTGSSSSTTVKKGLKKSVQVTSSKIKKESKGKAFAVFNDEEDDLAGENLLPNADTANTWSEYANESERVKENKQEPTPWTGATCPQIPVVKKNYEKFNVFQDDGENDDIVSNDKRNERVLSLKTIVDEDLVDGIINEKAATSSKSAVNFNAAIKDGKECSFEEARYEMQRRLRQDKVKVKEKESQNTSTFIKMEKESQNTSTFIQKEKESQNTSTFIKMEKESQNTSTFIQKKKESQNTSTSIKKEKEPSRSAIINSNKEKEVKHCASPTINTKAAMQDVFEMFSKPLNASVWEDEDETISAKVYRPESFKIGVFHDDEEEENDLQPNGIMNLQIQDLENLPDKDAKTPKILSTYPLQSTPLIGMINENLGDPNPPATIIRPSLRPFDIMTPITEVSEDRTFAGIYSDKLGSSISGDDSNGSYFHPNPAQTDELFSPFSRSIISTDLSKNESSMEVLNSLEEANLEKENECTYEMMDIPNPCNPYEDTIIQAILDSVPIPANSGLHSYLGEAIGIRKDLDSALSSASASKSKLDFVFTLGPKEKYKLIKKIGEGGYGQVYLVTRYKAGLLAEHDEDYTVNCTFSSKKPVLPSLALKLETPPAPWEFYILSLLRSRLPNRVNDAIAKPISCYLYKDESALLMEYMNQGTLLNCVNLAHSGGYGAGSSSGATMINGQAGVDELLAAFWTIELLRIIETIHAAGVIHGDVKPDNVMIRMLDGGSDWDSIYRSDGSAGWNSKGLSLIDWGSAIDVLSFPEDQKFLKIKYSGDSAIECWQVRHEKPWTYEIDWYGCAAIIHVLLFGTYMSVTERETDNVPHIELKSHYKRYWNSSLWKDLFDLLLNAGVYNTELLQKSISESITVEDSLLGPGTDFEVLEQEFPLIQKIHDKRLEMEIWLKTCCCTGGKSLRNLLRRVEIALLDSSS